MNAFVSFFMVNPRLSSSISNDTAHGADLQRTGQSMRP
jgi:hypothetical protein